MSKLQSTAADRGREREREMERKTGREARGQLGQLERALHVKQSERLLQRVCIKQAAKMWLQGIVGRDVSLDKWEAELEAGNVSLCTSLPFVEWRWWWW